MRISREALVVVCCLLCGGAALAAQQATTTQQALERWNKEFAGPLANLNRQPNAGLVAAVAGRRPGRALDVGAGEGRNSIYLAEHGWDVTAVDLSDVAIAQARKNAAARGVKLNAVVGDLDVYDFGTEQFDLVLSFYIHAWHDRTKTDVPSRIYQALKPGGLLVMEAYARPEVAFGFDPDTLAKQYSRFKILRNDSVNDFADWDKDSKRHLVRFVAQKPQ